MTGIHPVQSNRPTSSHAEMRVYDALQAGLPNGWTAWHSLKIRDNHGTEGEGDFVVVDPDNGLVVIEVKGGSLEARDGRWFQNGQPMQHSPLDQAQGYVRKLVDRLRQAGAPVPAFGVAVWFPDTPVEVEPTQDDMRGRILGANHLAWCAEALPPVVERALAPHQRPVDRRTISTLHELWGETWTPSLSLGQRVRMDESARVQLDNTQRDLLDGLKRNQRLLVTGGPGTGKTLLACEAARRLAAEGQRVLVLCFTQALGQWLAAHLQVEGVECRSISQLAVDLVEQRGGQTPDADDPAFWEDVHLLATEAVTSSQGGWDAVIIDEAQDLTESHWLFVEALCGDGRLWAFEDPAQAFWDDRRPPEQLFSSFFELTNGYRSPPELLRVAESIRDGRRDEDAVRVATETDRLAWIECPSVSSIPDKVANEVQKLRGAGLAPSEIAVISVRGLGVKESVLHSDALAAHQPVRADDPGIEEHVVADTFLRFKGLERPAVVVTDLHLVEGDASTRLFIALTRALTTARVVTVG